jgi:pyruvate/2-oxoglutarate/acetoin dehydrogenase E1 component
MLCLESLRQGLIRAFEADDRVVLLGEDVLDPYGGAFKVTKGLSSSYPDRVYPTPISEGAIVGLCTGLALRGLRPVGEIMFGDFLTLCADQIINSATKFPLMYEGKVTVPWVLRTPMAGIRGYGPTHSQSLEKLFFGVPGLEVIAPSRLHEPAAMIEYAVLQSERPTLFVEDKGDYPKALMCFEAGPLHLVGAGSDPCCTRIVRNFVDGRLADVQIVAYGGAASMAAEVLGGLVTEEVFGTLYAVARVNDRETLNHVALSLDPRVPLLIIEQGAEGFGWSAELTARILACRGPGSCPPIRSLAALSGAIPAAPALERRVVVTPERIEAVLLELLE